MSEKNAIKHLALGHLKNFERFGKEIKMTNDNFARFIEGLASIMGIPATNKDVVYIAGPMRGRPNYNFDAFIDAEEKLSEEFEVINPARLEFERIGFDPYDPPKDHDFNEMPDGLDLRDVVVRDIKTLADCDAIYLLPDWEKSSGALAEAACARWLELEIYADPSATPPDMVWHGNEVVNRIKKSLYWL